MYQTVQLVGRLSPKTKVNLEQKIQKQSSNKIFAKAINGDIQLDPLLDDIIPFSEIVNQRKMLQSLNPIQYIEEVRPQRALVLTQAQLNTNKSIKSNSTKREEKSRITNQKYDLISCCSCSCCGCSRKSSTRTKKTPTPKKLKKHHSTEKSNKSIKSTKSIKQYSLNSSESRKQKQLIQKHTSSQSVKQRCEYHNYEHRYTHQTLHSSQNKQRPSSVAMQNPETIRRQKLQEYYKRQKDNYDNYSAKKLNPTKRIQSQTRVPWRVDQLKIKEGLMKKSRIQNIIETQRQIAIETRNRSNSKKIDCKTPSNNDNNKVKQIEQRKQLMKQKKTKIIHNKKEQERLKKILSELKKQKDQEEIFKNQEKDKLKKIQEIQKKKLKHSVKIEFNPTADQIDKAFKQGVSLE